MANRPKKCAFCVHLEQLPDGHPAWGNCPRLKTGLVIEPSPDTISVPVLFGCEYFERKGKSKKHKRRGKSKKHKKKSKKA